ncbi:Uncharacterized protein, contains ferredoxin domain [Desulfotomaculum arcticum]|uniref:Uncharacterized protein, contains ferredoxin domain n=1 Tax=Desulfotruncus arcticus DSM 17038 TaxID=1121424 RepID=A0A1I2VXT5_9FIRM|nr:DUF2148 domain-containing protein [Desulfotruncus arcticus]SFG93862.1 Uncharacterized protein, contains ferredoxin domain [Desulfotomaculum arcticum] [Desulfotruncus arcticus DSM 17038]
MPVININDWPPFAPSDMARREGSLNVARLMANAALTAPKGGGVDQIECCIVYGQQEQEQIAKKVEELATHNQKNTTWYRTARAEAIMAREADCILFIGNYRAGDSPFDVGCGLCGGDKLCAHVYSQRQSKYGQIDLIEGKEQREHRLIDGPLCTFWVGDLGYAVGSASFLARQMFVDSRPLVSVGIAGQKFGYCSNSSIVLALPIASLQKNPFVDIMPDYHMLSFDKAVKQLRKNYVVTRQVHWYDYKNWFPKVKQEEEEV